MNDVLKQLEEKTCCVNLIRDEPTNHSYCKYLTNRIGRLYPVNKPICNLECKKNGPYNNRQISLSEEKDFVTRAWKRFSPVTSKSLVNKVLTNYQLPMDIIIPEEYHHIKSALSFLKDCKEFTKIMLTGSCITSTAKKPLKDLDVVICFSGTDEFLSESIGNKLPKEINGVKVDYFICIGTNDSIPNLYFMCLDVEDKLLYTSKWFKPKINSLPEGVSLVESEYENFDSLLKTMLTDSEKRTVNTRVSWKSVEKTWNKAADFLTSVKSRGVISTTLDYANIDNSLGEKTDEKTYEKRRVSCFGDGVRMPCKFLTELEGTSFCGACGCGANKLARLDGENNEYTKLHYPFLQCPLQRIGFSNEETNVLSVIITVLNENSQYLQRTIETIKSESDTIEIIIVDDKSDVPVIVTDSSIKVIRNKERVGCAPSRHIGALNAKNKWILFTDSHMVFKSGWYNEFISQLQYDGDDNTAYCGVCLGLDNEHLELHQHRGKYNGARLSLFDSSENQILEGKWIDEKAGHEYEISCMMGAIYFINKDYFFKIRGLSDLKMWGSDEPCLSLKILLSGGKIKLIKAIEAGHIFRNSAPYSTGIEYLVYNKIRMAKTLLPESIGNKLIEKLTKDVNYNRAMEMINNEKLLLDEYKHYYQSIFNVDFETLCNKFEIQNV